MRVTVADKAGKQVRQLNARAEAGVINRASWDMRYDSPVPPAGAGAGGRGGRGRGGRGAAGRPRWRRRGRVQRSAEGAPAAPGRGEAGGELPDRIRRGGRRAGGGRGGGGGGGRGGFGAGRGALVDPGEYTVTIAANGKTRFAYCHGGRRSARADVRRRSRQAAEGRRHTVTMTKEADAARRKAVAMNTALTSLTDSWKQPNAPAVPDA